MDGIALLQDEIESRNLGNRRCVWIQPPPSGTPEGLLVFLDGEYYPVNYHEFPGGHATTAWHDDLPRAVGSLFGS